MKIIQTVITSVAVSVACIVTYMVINQNIKSRQNTEWRRQLIANVMPTYDEIKKQKASGKSPPDPVAITPEKDRQLYEIKKDMMKVCADLDRKTRQFKHPEETKAIAAGLLVEFQLARKPFLPVLLNGGISKGKAILINSELRQKITSAYLESLSDWELAVLCIQHVMDKSTSGGWGAGWDGTHGDIAYHSVEDGSAEQAGAKAYSALNKSLQSVVLKYHLENM